MGFGWVSTPLRVGGTRLSRGLLHSCCILCFYSHSPKNPTLQQFQKCSISASAGSYRPIWNSFGTVGEWDFWENGCKPSTLVIVQERWVRRRTTHLCDGRCREDSCDDRSRYRLRSPPVPRRARPWRSWRDDGHVGGAESVFLDPSAPPAPAAHRDDDAATSPARPSAGPHPPLTSASLSR